MICRGVLFLWLTSIPLIAQKPVTKYYDASYQQVKEEYFVSEEDKESLQGKYTRYFEDGKVAITGTFVDGVRSGTFLEYHENGTLLRKINYVNGMRHGAVEVYDETGKLIQRAFYQNNLLVDSVKSFFDTGITRTESYFLKGKPDGIVREYYPSGKPRKESLTRIRSRMGSHGLFMKPEI